MALLTPGQVAGYAYGAGIHDVRALTDAVAIAMAESAGPPPLLANTRAHNTTPPDDSYGLWQINMLGALGPQRRQQFGITSNDALFDPATNARAMVAVSSNGTNWRPWTTYGGFLYRAWLPIARANAEAAVRVGPVAGGVAGAVDAAADVGTGLADVSAGITKAGGWLSRRENWVRVAQVAAGMGLIWVGLSIVARPYAADAARAVGKVTSVVGKVVPA